jgi:serine protease Do
LASYACSKEIILQLKESGAVSRGYLGVLIKDVTEEMKEAMGLPAAKGVLVDDIVAGGPASKSELRRGDIILRVNGEEVNDSRSLQKNVAKTKPGAAAKLEILRDKKNLTISAKVGNLGETSQQAEAKGADSDTSDKIGIIIGMASDGSGVQIQAIEHGSVAEEAGLQAGDIIRKIDRKEIAKVEDYKKILNSLKSKATVLFDLERGKSKLFIAFKLP